MYIFIAHRCLAFYSDESHERLPLRRALSRHREELLPSIYLSIYLSINIYIHIAPPLCTLRRLARQALLLYIYICIYIYIHTYI